MKSDQLIPFTLVLTFGLVNNITLSPSFAQTTSSQSSSPISSQTPLFTPPKTSPGKGGRTSGTERGECPSINLPLTALIPDTNIGQTIAEHPTFWFYIPYSPELNLPVQFRLVDGNDQLVYETQPFLIKEQPGIISITLPNTVAPLEINRRYKWSFSVICDQNNRAQDTIVWGRIQRVSLNYNLKMELETADSLTKIRLYGQNGLWYEMLNGLAQMRLQNPQDQTINHYWINLLNSVGLNNIATEPIRF